MTDEEFNAWLKDQSAIRCILVEAAVNASDVEITRYLSSKGYVTGAADTPSHTSYLPLIVGGVQFTESLDIDGQGGLSFGDIELANFNGDVDAWLDDVWVNRQIQVFIGDVRWARADFRTIFDGITDDIDSSDRNTLNIKIRDKLQRLNSPVSETKLGGTSIYKERLIPICLGECFNVTPLLTNEATHEYQVHDGPIEDIIEVRDNGVPVSITKDLANGKFTLNQNPAGNITASVQGDKPSTYENTVSQLVQRLATGYGKASTQFTSADLDTANLAAFDTANSQPVGIYLQSRTNVLTAINALADSVGAHAVMSRAGKLRLLKIELPPSGTPTAITAYDMEANDLKIEQRIPVQSAFKIGFCKNWTVQPDLQTGIPEEHKAFFADEWISQSDSDSTVATKYKLDAEPVMKETLLLTESDASAEATRLTTLYKTPRAIYAFTGYANLINLNLGDAVTLTHSRFGLSGGVTGMVVKLQIDWFNFRVSVGVLA